MDTKAHLWYLTSSWLRHKATSRKFAGSNPYEVIGFFFQVALCFQSFYCPVVHSSSNRNKYQEYFWGGGKARSARRVEISTPSVSLLFKNFGILDVSLL
jgi:hypothetical protein